MPDLVDFKALYKGIQTRERNDGKDPIHVGTFLTRESRTLGWPKSSFGFFQMLKPK